MGGVLVRSKLVKFSKQWNLTPSTIQLGTCEYFPINYRMSVSYSQQEMNPLNCSYMLTPYPYKVQRGRRSKIHLHGDWMWYRLPTRPKAEEGLFSGATITLIHLIRVKIRVKVRVIVMVRVRVHNGPKNSSFLGILSVY